MAAWTAFCSLKHHPFDTAVANPIAMIEDDRSRAPAAMQVLDTQPAASSPPWPVEGEDPTLPPSGSVVGGNYRILRELGRGAMGVVMLARDERLQRDVALKLIRDNAADKDFVRLFLREARAMARVNHPNVLCIHAFGEHGALPYFVAERVVGQSLDAWMTDCNGLADLDLALNIIESVCRGVDAIHEAGTVHRDLKPSNILIDSELRVRIADFGVSRSFQEAGDGCELVGTPAYMAPEVVLAAGDGSRPSPLSDVYSLGCIAFELLTGERPFEARGLMGWLLHHVSEPPRRPSAVQPRLPTSFDRPLLRALAKAPRDRTPSAGALVQELRRAAQDNRDPKRILLAEDDADFRVLLQDALELEFPSADVEGVDDGEAALASLARRPACIALIDLEMPSLDGLSVTAVLRAGSGADRMPIIVLTGRGGAEEWRHLAELGADGFLVKPFRMEDLVTLIRRSIAERAQADREPWAPPGQ